MQGSSELVSVTDSARPGTGCRLLWASGFPLRRATVWTPGGRGWGAGVLGVLPAMLRSPLPQTCTLPRGSSCPWKASIAPAWGGSVCTGWGSVFPAQSSSPGKCWEDGLPSQQPPHLAWAAGSPLSFLGEQNGMKDSSPSLKRKHTLLVLSSCAPGVFWGAS